MGFCPECGTAQEVASAKFCGNCGAPSVPVTGIPASGVPSGCPPAPYGTPYYPAASQRPQSGTAALMPAGPFGGTTPVDVWEKFSWASLPERFKRNWKVLGFNQVCRVAALSRARRPRGHPFGHETHTIPQGNWDDPARHGGAPPSTNKDWHELSQAERSAAAANGYTQHMWDNDLHPDPLPPVTAGSEMAALHEAPPGSFKVQLPANVSPGQTMQVRLIHRDTQSAPDQGLVTGASGSAYAVAVCMQPKGTVDQCTRDSD